ncbi:metallothiol transferase FosB-like [Dioscorea cayenensis subsp. rotundata]|uniref:Metallothiol transferase FosB-like n=1 Tax=Dioscorea cayennensis subsp. rotundata TaxID=55577 RepID=A0AB40BZH4_DIOCR|nr:metallothiol transferase FosB-like [Dioscorea cayenensis subsp. rotundata]
MGLEIIEEEVSTPVLPLMSLNHVSFLCSSVSRSVKFYEEVLGFVSIKRPSSFKFHGAWLFNYGVGIHLLQCNSPEDIPKKKGVINPKDNHISFQCSDMHYLKRKLEEMGIQYVTAIVEEGGILVDQIFFHDPDGYMVEICNCENIPILPLSSCPLKFPYNKDSFFSSVYGKCRDEVETVIMEALVTDMMDISF